MAGRHVSTTSATAKFTDAHWKFSNCNPRLVFPKPLNPAAHSRASPKKKPRCGPRKSNISGRRFQLQHCFSLYCRADIGIVIWDIAVSACRVHHAFADPLSATKLWQINHSNSNALGNLDNGKNITHGDSSDGK
jgi:hypothetical protein